MGNKRLAGERYLRGTGKRNLAKRKDTFMQILKHEYTDIPTCRNMLSYTYKDTGAWITSIHTDTNMFIHMHSCAQIHIHTKYAQTVHLHIDVHPHMYAKCVYPQVETQSSVHIFTQVHSHRTDTYT